MTTSRGAARAAVLLAAALLLHAAPAPAAANVFVASVVPAGFVPPAVVVSAAAPSIFVNTDPLPSGGHDVTASTATRPSGSASWCVGQYATTCPLFWSETIDGGASTPVLGFEDAEPGMTYDFWCSIHTGMTGTVTVV